MSEYPTSGQEFVAHKTKISHKTKAAARSHARSLAKKTGSRGVLNVYKCETCDGWHVGHAPWSAK